MGLFFIDLFAFTGCLGLVLCECFCFGLDFASAGNLLLWVLCFGFLFLGGFKVVRQVFVLVYWCWWLNCCSGCG